MTVGIWNTNLRSRMQSLVPEFKISKSRQNKTQFFLSSFILKGFMRCLIYQNISLFNLRIYSFSFLPWIGRKFNKNGELTAQWWSQDSLDGFNAKAKCVENQYSMYKINRLISSSHCHRNQSAIYHLTSIWCCFCMIFQGDIFHSNSSSSSYLVSMVMNK